MTTTEAAVKERPILFSGPMVRAILDGRKTQTRRIVKPQPTCPAVMSAWSDGKLIDCNGKAHCIWPADYVVPETGLRPDLFASCPYGMPGARLWVRETFSDLIDPGADDKDVKKTVWLEETSETEYWVVDYFADGPHTRIMDKVGSRKWKPSIHMPRWASRINLKITGIRVERLQDITEADSVAEGVQPFWTSPGYLVVEENGNTSEIGEEFIHGIPKAGDEWLGMKVAHVQHKPGRQMWDARKSYCNLWSQINGPVSWDQNPWVWCVEFKRV